MKLLTLFFMVLLMGCQSAAVNANQTGSSKHQDTHQSQPSLITLTEATNLATEGYVWTLSHSFLDLQEVKLLNPHPTLDVLNQRAIQIAKEHIKAQSDTKSDETLKNVGKNTQIHIRFVTFNDLTDKNHRLIRDTIGDSGCSSNIPIAGTFILIISVNEQGRDIANHFRDMDNSPAKSCLLRKIRRKNYMIYNVDGVPERYTMFLPVTIHGF
ncbi:hypothetical protein [Moraxella sp. VT-16-12]|uniref:hypothetical protein n=1 Tax=Moraxella sp. VT-16-12 TaxID=2014877 RepID=UPI000B7EF55A|nr:hypothetical protein [Moraxella sp. VT-16-12]TWV82897.1 hypothetical protein CEW93_004310 [Moraxella sp. VT-16-12]